MLEEEEEEGGGGGGFNAAYVIIFHFIKMYCVCDLLPHKMSGIEHRGRMVSTSTSYSGGPGFESRPGDQLS
jgi:hypothetical protein